MAVPSNFVVTPLEGIDVTTYYNVTASTTPETPAPPFQTGTQVQGNQASEFVFVQASTTINLGDFVAVSNGLTANSMTSTNVLGSLGCRIGIAGWVARQSLTYIPAGAYFWAQLRGVGIPGNGTGPAALLGAAVVQLYTSGTAGIVTSTSATSAAGLLGIEVISSVTPIYNLTWPRTVKVISTSDGLLSSATTV